MKRIVLTILLMLAGVGACEAQTTTVTGTVVDPNGNAYANGTVSAFSVTSTGQAQNFFTPVSTNASGFFTISLNSGATYIFTVCAPPVLLGVPTTNPTPPQVCFTSQPLPISGVSVDISTSLNAISNVLGPKAGGGGGGSGTVTSINLLLPTNLFINPTVPITTFGSLAANFVTNAPALQIFGNCSGITGTPGFCSLTSAMIPSINLGSSGNGGVTGSLPFGQVAGVISLNQSPLTTAGDTLSVSSGVLVRIPVGTNGFCYVVVAGLPAWQTCPGGLANPMTTLGDMIFGIAGGAPARLAGPTTPNGVPEFVSDTPASGAAVGEIFLLPGVQVRAVTGTTATDTIASTDCNPKRIAYQGSVAVAVTLPTATTLAVPNCTFRLTNNTTGASTAVTVTPTTWTVNPGGASLTIQQGQTCLFTVDPVGTAWDADCDDLQLQAGTGVTITRGQYGPTLSTSNSQFPCEPGLGDGLNAIAAGTYLQSNCYNNSGVTWNLTGFRCFTDNNGTSTMNVTNSAGTGLLTGAITCTNSFASGTQSGTITLAAGDFMKFTFVADGTSLQTTWAVSLTK